jgi:hypothetical protein
VAARHVAMVTDPRCRRAVARHVACIISHGAGRGGLAFSQQNIAGPSFLRGNHPKPFLIYLMGHGLAYPSPLPWPARSSLQRPYYHSAVPPDDITAYAELTTALNRWQSRSTYRRSRRCPPVLPDPQAETHRADHALGLRPVAELVTPLPVIRRATGSVSDGLGSAACAGRASRKDNPARLAP